ncbi:hypothetical protein C5167_050657 [Papaver somniferum]|uniref:Cytochrome P450 n=1 Tax=Papaver somniferum TaxID=3469 RepID=A0A4Y7KP79_PAPSO|nr:hypothetical protein C5167_050657 [Papaver somniferum]
MDFSMEAWWFALVFGGAPLLFWVLLTWWNEIWYIGPLKLRYGGYVKLPPGTMGLPYFGEMLSFLWYFKILRLPDEFIEAKRQSPDALKRTVLVVQPRISSSLQLWDEKGTLNGMKETNKVTFANIGKLFANIELGPVVDLLDGYFAGIIGGCRKSAIDIFRKELESRRLHAKSHIKERNDLMDGLINMKYEQGKQLVIAGYESTSLASMWGLYYLAKFPDVLQNLRDENLAMTHKKNGDFITAKDISELKYTNKVVEETIRLSNVAPFIFRLVKEDTEYQGYKIPKYWKSSFGYDIFTQTQGIIMIQCPSIQTDGMYETMH